jgi:hypothetical protein
MRSHLVLVLVLVGSQAPGRSRRRYCPDRRTTSEKAPRIDQGPPQFVRDLPLASKFDPAAAAGCRAPRRRPDARSGLSDGLDPFKQRQTGRSRGPVIPDKSTGRGVRSPRVLRLRSRVGGPQSLGLFDLTGAYLPAREAVRRGGILASLRSQDRVLRIYRNMSGTAGPQRGGRVQSPGWPGPSTRRGSASGGARRRSRTRWTPSGSVWAPSGDAGLWDASSLEGFRAVYADLVADRPPRPRPVAGRRHRRAAPEVPDLVLSSSTRGRCG